MHRPDRASMSERRKSQSPISASSSNTVMPIRLAGRADHKSRHLNITSRPCETESVGQNEVEVLSDICQPIQPVQAFGHLHSYNERRQTPAAHGSPFHGQVQHGVLSQWTGSPSRETCQKNTSNIVSIFETNPPLPEHIIESTARWPTATSTITSLVRSDIGRPDGQLVRVWDNALQNLDFNSCVLPANNQQVAADRPQVQLWQRTPEYNNANHGSLYLEPHLYQAQDRPLWSPSPVGPLSTYDVTIPASTTSAINKGAINGPRQGRRRYIQDNADGTEASRSSGLSTYNSRYFCTFSNCPGPFDELQQWKRHERETHAPRFIWTCILSRLASHRGALCPINGCGLDINGPWCVHRIPDCVRGRDARSFSRKEGLKRHLTEQHCLTLEEGEPIAAQSSSPYQLDDRALFCFFCWKRHTDWENRVYCVANHMEHGLTKAQWDDGVASAWWLKNIQPLN